MINPSLLWSLCFQGFKYLGLTQDVSWRLMPGQRVGLVGANGCGKSTLLRCLSGHRKVDNGRLVVGSRVEMGYLEQTAVSGSGRTVWEEARSRMTELIEAEAAIDAASQAASQGTFLSLPMRALGYSQAATKMDKTKPNVICIRHVCLHTGVACPKLMLTYGHALYSRSLVKSKGLFLHLLIMLCKAQLSIILTSHITVTS